MRASELICGLTKTNTELLFMEGSTQPSFLFASLWRIQDRISLGVYGYIEAKGPSNEPFDTTPYRDQINRYLTLGHKLIITDGIDFV